MSIIHMYVLKLLFHSTTSTDSYDYNTAFSLFYVVSFFFLYFTFARLSASRERNHSTWGRKRGGRRRGRRKEEKGGRVADSVWYVSRAIGSVSSVCGLCCCQELTEKAEGGRVDVGMACRVGRWWGQEGGKVDGLALGLFATISFPLSALAHLHLCQLDVPQHVGVCDGERER